MTATALPALRAFHGDPAIKAKYRARMAEHIKLDQLVAGIGFEVNTRKGCFVGCTLDRYDHAGFETELGIPRELARLADGIFESLKPDRRPWFAEAILAAPMPGADLSEVRYDFLSWLMLDPIHGLAFTTRDAEIADLAAEVGFRYAAREVAGPEADVLADRLRDARDARAARAAWAAWDARDARDARTARAAWDARDAWAAWGARGAFVLASAEMLVDLLAAATPTEAPEND